jgi:hypothetical protein
MENKKMKEYSVKSYSFSELDEKAQGKAIEDHANFLNNYMDNDDLAERMNGVLAAILGFDYHSGQPLKVEDWDLSYSQGSHVGIKGEITRDDAPLFAWSGNVHSLALNYHHYYGQQVMAYDEEGEELDTDKDLKDLIYGLAQDLMAAGYKEIEYRTSRPVVIESIEINGYEFNADGSIFSGIGAELVGAE